MAACAQATRVHAADAWTPDTPLDAWLLALVVIALAGVACGWIRHARRLTAELQAVRVESRSLADLIEDGHWRSDANHCITRWRPPRQAPAAAWLLRAHDMTLWTARDTGAERPLRAVLDARAPIDDVVAEVKLADGRTIDCELRGTVVTDSLGRFAGYLGTARLLTAVVAQPRAVTHASSKRELAHATTETLPDHAHESFSYTVSHDLRAPIRVIEGFTKILKEDYGRLLDRIGNDHLDRVLGAAARMNNMVDALLALSQLSTQPLARQPVNLSQLAGYVTDDLRRQTPERHVQVCIDPDLVAQGDPTLLRMVLENLLGNAWKYTGKTREPQIWFGHDPQQPSNSFTVRDNGAGFDMRFADRLFGVFQRLHSAADFQGTGVGLASVRRIVRRHGGDIWADGVVDQGASFHFTLGGE